MRSVLICGSETWPFIAEGMQRPLVSERPFLYSKGRIYWGDFMTNLEVKRKVPSGRVQSLAQTLNPNRLRWLEYVSCKSTERPSDSLHAVFRGRQRLEDG